MKSKALDNMAFCERPKKLRKTPVEWRVSWDKQLIALYKELNHDELAKLFNVSNSTVKNRMKQLSLKKRDQYKRKDLVFTDDQIKQMIVSGQSINQIAREHKFSHLYLARRVKAMGEDVYKTAIANGIKRQAKVRAIRIFDKEQIEWIKEKYKTLPAIKVTEEFNVFFNAKITSGQMIRFFKNHKITKDSVKSL